MLDCRRVDQPVRGIAGERRGQSYGGIGNRRSDADRSQLSRQAFQPGSDRDIDSDPLMPCKPGKLVPRDRRNRELFRSVKGFARRCADPIRLGGPPVHDMGVKKEPGHTSSGMPGLTGGKQLLLVDRGHRNSLERPFQRSGSEGRHQACDRATVPGDLYLLAGSGIVEKSKDRGLRIRCGHLFSHMASIAVSSTPRRPA